MEPIYIGIHGKRYAGKDYVARILGEYLQGFSYSVAFADPLKSRFANYKGIPVNYLHDTATKETYRPELIQFSAMVKETEGLDCWVREHKNMAEYSGSPIILIPDLRYPLEYENLRTRHSITVCVSASGEDRAARGWSYDPAIDTHITEVGLDHITDWDYEVVNSNTPDPDFRDHLKRICRYSLQKWALVNLG